MSKRIQILPRRWPWIAAFMLLPAGVLLYQTTAEERLDPADLLPPDAERAADARAVLSAVPGDGADIAQEQARLGRELYEQWRYRDARAALELALELDPNTAGAYCDLGLVELRQPGDLKRAAALFEKAMELDPEDGRYPLGLAGALGAQIMNSGSMLKGAMRVPRIKELLQKSVELDPDSIDSQMAMLQFYLVVPGFLGGSPEEALKHATALEGLDGAEGLAARAMIESQGERYEEAEALYAQAVEAYPDYGPAARAFGAFLMRRERYADACARLQEAVRIDPGDPDAHDSLGSAWQKAGRFSDASSSFRRALELNPDSLSARVHLATCLDESGDESGAAELYREVGARAEEGYWAEKAVEWLGEHGG